MCNTLNITIYNLLYNSRSIPITRCGIPKELTVLTGIAGKAGDLKATVEVINGRGSPTVVHRRTDIVNHITNLKYLIGKLLLN